MMKYIAMFFSFLLSFSSAFGQANGRANEAKNTRNDSLIAKKGELNLSKPLSTPSEINAEVGYRVQVFYGLDRREAFNEQARFKTLYPNLRSYITYREPNYYLRVGDFKTRPEAQELLTALRQNFPTLFIFREKINWQDLEPNKQ